MPDTALLTPPFGFVAAEQEAGAHPDIYYSRTSPARDALDPRVSIIIGRRGAGKTALLKHLLHQHAHRYAIQVRFDEASAFTAVLGAVSEQISAGQPFVPEELAKLWELTFWGALMSNLRRSGKVDGPAVKTLDAALRSLTFGQATGPDVSRSVLDVMHSAAVGRAKLLVELLVLARNYLTSPSFASGVAVTKNYLNAGHRAVIVIDTLDTFPLRHESMRRALGSLLYAVERFALGQQHPMLEIKCFLPGEVVDSLRRVGPLPVARTLQFPLHLTWTAADLLKVICWRYVYVWNDQHEHDQFPQQGSATISWDIEQAVRAQVWDEIFPGIVANAQENREDSFDFILRHSQMRPRQIIWLCNSIAEMRPQQHGRRPRAFSRDDLLRGVAAVTPKMADEMFMAYSEIYPNAIGVFEFVRGQTNVFDRASDFLALAHKTRRVWADSESNSPELVLKMACDMGLVGRVVE